MQICSELKEQTKKEKSLAPNCFVTINNFNSFFFDQGKSDRNLSAEELELLFFCLSTMLGFILKDKQMTEKRIDKFKYILKKTSESAQSGSDDLKKMIKQMNHRLKFFMILKEIIFEDLSVEKKEWKGEEQLRPELLNLLALQNIQKGDLNNAQLILKRAILKTKLCNRTITADEYFNEIYNRNPKANNDKSKSKAQEKKSKRDQTIDSTFHNKESLIYNSGLLLLKRKKYLKAIDIFNKLKPTFQNNFRFWYRLGQASKGVFIEDIGHVSKLYDYYFFNRKKKFYSEDGKAKTEKVSEGNGIENNITDFIDFFSNLSENQNLKTEGKKNPQISLRNIIIKKKLVSIFKAKDLLSLTNKLYSKSLK